MLQPKLNALSRAEDIYSGCLIGNSLPEVVKSAETEETFHK